MADPIKRLNYFKHQFLRAKDFNEEQSYHVGMRRRHNRHLHTWGIAGDGLKVTFAQGATAVRVSQGMAVDREGREIVLVEDQTVELAGVDPGVAAYITISYSEVKSDPTTETGAEGDTRWTEAPVLRPDPAKPGDVGLSIILGRVRREGTKVVGVDESDRRSAGVSTGELTVRTLTLSRPDVDASTWPRLSCSSANYAALENGSLRLEATREVFFADGGQLRSFDNAHRIVFNRPNNRLEMYEFGDIVFSTGGATPPERLRIGATGNVGIGRTAAADRLEVQGNVRAGALLFIDGAGALYQDNWLGMANNIEGATKWLHVGGITDGGVRRIALVADRVLATGRLGVGVTAPAAQLHLSGGQWDVGSTDGDLKIGSATTSLKIGVATGGGGAGDVRMRAVGGTNRLILGSAAADTLTVVGPNVGIGTYTPVTQLHIRNDARSALGPVLTLMNGAGGANAGAAVDFHSYDPGPGNAPASRLVALDDGNYSTHLSFQTKDSGGPTNALVERVRITNVGTVGIGTPTPDRALTIQGAGGGMYMNVKASGGGVELLMGADGGGGIISTMTNHDLQLRSGSNNARVWVKAGGNVGVGTGNPQDSLDVSGAVRILSGSNPIRFTSAWSGFPDNATDRAEISNDTSGYKTLMIIGNKSAGLGRRVSVWDRLEVNGLTKTNKLQLGDKWLLSGDGDAESNDEWLRLKGVADPKAYNGGFAALKLWSSGGVVQGSDVRLKKEITPLGDATAGLLALHGVRFKWQDEAQGDAPQLGLIAQEVEQFFPELVTDGPDGMKGINYAGLIAPLVEAVKEQQSQIAELRAEMQRLKARPRARKRTSTGENQ